MGPIRTLLQKIEADATREAERILRDSATTPERAARVLGAITFHDEQEAEIRRDSWSLD